MWHLQYDIRRSGKSVSGKRNICPGAWVRQTKPRNLWWRKCEGKHKPELCSWMDVILKLPKINLPIKSFRLTLLIINLQEMRVVLASMCGLIQHQFMFATKPNLSHHSCTQESSTSAGTSHLWQCTVSSPERASRFWDRPGPPGLWRLVDRTRNGCWPSIRLRSFSSPGCWPGGRTQMSKPPSAAGLARSDQDWSWAKQHASICKIDEETQYVQMVKCYDILLLQSQSKYPSSQWGGGRCASVRLCAFIVQICTSLQESFNKTNRIIYQIKSNLIIEFKEQVRFRKDALFSGRCSLRCYRPWPA